jgi:hypothetical protein
VNVLRTQILVLIIRIALSILSVPLGNTVQAEKATTGAPRLITAPFLSQVAEVGVLMVMRVQMVKFAQAQCNVQIKVALKVSIALAAPDVPQQKRGKIVRRGTFAQAEKAAQQVPTVLRDSFVRKTQLVPELAIVRK